MNGHGTIVFSHVAGRTVPTTVRAESPLRLLTPQNHGMACWAYSSSFGGGFVDGDVVSMQVVVDDDASALLATQASTKIYRGAARMQLDARLGERALLAVIPDPVVCFEGASYAQRLSFVLQPTSSLVLVDSLTAGRSARGERWAFSRYESRLGVGRADEARLLDDPVRLDATEAPIASRFGRFDAMATLVLLGPALCSAAQSLLARLAAEPVPRRGDVVMTASPLHDGALVRVVATSADILADHVRAALSFLPALLGDDPWARKF